MMVFPSGAWVRVARATFTSQCRLYNKINDIVLLLLTPIVRGRMFMGSNVSMFFGAQPFRNFGARLEPNSIR